VWLADVPRFGDLRKPTATPAQKPLPDFAELSPELTANRHTSLQLPSEQYRDRNPESHYSYVSFWRRYDQWRLVQDVVIGQQLMSSKRHPVRLPFPLPIALQRPSQPHAAPHAAARWIIHM
jgi:hypothetical protein